MVLHIIYERCNLTEYYAIANRDKVLLSPLQLLITKDENSTVNVSHGTIGKTYDYLKVFSYCDIW